MSCLTAYYQNVRGLRTKLNDVLLNSVECGYDVMCLTETWLNCGVADGEVLCSDYSVFRRDRNLLVTGKSDGGGALIGVRDSLRCIGRSEWHSDAEDVWVTVFPGNPGSPRLHICCVYIPPADKVAINCFCTKLVDIMSSVPSCDNVIVFGDFNLPHLSWSVSAGEPSLVAGPAIDAVSTEFVDVLSFAGLNQFNGIVNVNNRVLDLVLSTMANVGVVASDSPLSVIDRHHIPLEVSFSIDNMKEISVSRGDIFLFGCADYDAINDALSGIDWAGLFSSHDVNVCVQLFYNKLRKIIKRHVPVRAVGGHRYPPWFTTTLIRLIKQKHKAHINYKKYRTDAYYNIFSLLRSRCKRLIKQCHNDFVGRTELQLKENSKQFWSYLRSKKIVSTIPNCMKYNSSVATSGQDICNLFNEFFKSSFVVGPGVSPVSDVLSTVDAFAGGSLFKLSEEQVLTAIAKLKPNKGAGPDGIPSNFIVKCSSSLCQPLTLIFTKSLKTGVFPQVWKEAFVTPIFKSGEKSLVKNYRPISKLSIFSKIL